MERRNSDSVNGSVSLGYNSDFRAINETIAPAPTVAGLGTVTYDYDADGLPTCASLGTCATATTKNKLSLTYGAATGFLTDTALDSVKEHYASNEYGEGAVYSASYGTSPLLSITYDGATAATKRDGLGRVAHVTDTASGVTVVTDYQYDEQGRLWKVSQGGTLLNQYLYDERGNRVSTDGTTTNAHYDAQDRLLDYDNLTYSYWDNGARRERRDGAGITGQYTYDAVGNLSLFVKPNVVQVDYTVDALDRRILKKNNGVPVAQYIYGAGTRIAAVLDGGGTLAARFVYASHPNTPDYMVLADGTVYKFLSDQLGSPRLIVNSITGAIAERIDYDAWGKATLATTAAFPSWKQPFGFAGGLYDEDTGLVRFGARDYDPEVGRWLSKDPILLRGGQTDLYVYAGNDPINSLDPSGFWGFTIGDGVDAGFCVGLCVGSYGAAGGLYVGSEGIGVYGSAQAGAGFGAHAGASAQLGIYSSLDALAGSSYGAEGSSFFGGASVTANSSGGVVTIGAGPGGGIYGGLFTSGTLLYGLRWREISDAIDMFKSKLLTPLGPPPICR